MLSKLRCHPSVYPDLAVLLLAYGLPVACPSAGLNLDVLLPECLEKVDLRLAILVFIRGTGLRMCTHEELVALRDGEGLDLLTEALVTAQRADTTHHN